MSCKKVNCCPPDAYEYQIIPDDCASLDADLIGRWKLNEGEGTYAYDSSFNDNHGRFYNHGNPVPVDGDWAVADGKACVEMDGTNASAWAQVEDDPTLALDDESFTVSIWHRPTVVKLAALMHKQDGGNGFNLGMGTGLDNGKPLFNVGATNVVAAEAIELDEWALITAVYDKDFTEMTLYVNGVISAQETSAISILPSVVPLKIGVSLVPDYWVNGYLRDARIYRRALTEGEVAALYSEGCVG